MGRTLGQRLRGGSAWFLLPGLILCLAVGAGAADVLRHGHEDLGRATAYGRFTQLRCGGGKTTGGCTRAYGVHIRLDHAPANVGTVLSTKLYALVGPGGRSVAVRLQEDPVTHKVERVYANGRWFDLAKHSELLLIILVPLGVVGLALVALGLVPFCRAIGRGVTRHSRLGCWSALVVGAAVFIFCIPLTAVGLSGDRYPVGSGTLLAPSVSFGSTGIHEFVRVHIDQFGTEHRAESTRLFALVPSANARVPVDSVEEDAASKVTAVTHLGQTYRLDGGNWLALFLVVPVALIGLAAAWLNGRALLRERRSAIVDGGPAGY